MQERGPSASQREHVVVSPELSHLQLEDGGSCNDDNGSGQLASDGFPVDFGHTSRLQQLLACECS